MSLAADESEDWSPINFAKLRQCSLRLRVIASRVRTGQEDAPACCHEPSIAAAVMGGIRSHSRRIMSFVLLLRKSDDKAAAPGRLDGFISPCHNDPWKPLTSIFNLFSKLHPEKSEESSD